MSVDTEEIQRRILSLPVRWQVAMLVSYVDHVVGMADRVGAIPPDVRTLVVEPATLYAWRFAESGLHEPATALAIEDAVERVWQALVDGLREDAQHLASACELLVHQIPGPMERAKNVLNHLDGYIELADPEGVGFEEESDWRIQVLSEVETVEPLTRDLFSLYIGTVLPWADRFAEDWNS